MADEWVLKHVIKGKSGPSGDRFVCENTKTGQESIFTRNTLPPNVKGVY
jgi:hypothetical protein